MLDRPFLSRFSPQRTDPEALEQILVQRHDLLAESVERIRDSVLTDNKHHLLFIGPRGIGKTNLVSLIVHRLKKQPKLQSKMRLAWLNEDETATSFLKLLILIYRDLTQRYPDEFPAADLQRVYGHKPDHARELLGASLLEHLGKRTLVVIMENLDSLFKDMPVEEQRTWRAFVQNHPVFATVGTAQSLFDGVSERTEPFFGFFDTRHLDNLTVDEAITLLKNIAKLNGDTKLEAYLATPTGHARVQAIHDLAGGNPRIYMIFSSFLTVELLDDLVRPFEETADQQLTSYYQERLRWLSAQQREIVQYLCHQRFPVPVKQIAEGMFASHQTIANQLKLLRDYRYVRGNERGREVLYELSEPLMRLALQVKETHDRKPLSLIVDFLRVWYDKSDIEEWLGKLPAGARARSYFEAALDLINSDQPNLRHELLRNSLSCIGIDAMDETVIESMRVLASETGDLEDLTKLATALIAHTRVNEGLEVFDRVCAMPNVPSQLRAFVGALRAWSFMNRHDDRSAIEEATIAIGEPNLDVRWRSFALVSRGVARRYQGDFVGAISDISSAIGCRGLLPEVLALAYFTRAQCHQHVGDEESAIKDYDQALELPGLNNEQVAWAHISRGSLHIARARLPEASRDFNAVLAMNNPPEDALARLCFVKGTVNSAIKQHSEALKDFAMYFELARRVPIDHRDVADFVVSERVIVSIFEHIQAPTGWGGIIEEFLGHFSAQRIIAELGDALIEHLPSLAASSLNHVAYDAWADAWTAAADSLKPEDRQQLEIPLRLLRAGIDYYKTKDEGVLLSLPSEERKILRQVLKLDPEPAA